MNKVVVGLAFLIVASNVLAQTIQPKIVVWDDKGYKKTKNRNAGIFYNQGVNALNGNNYQEGIKFFKEALELDPHFIEALDELGLCYRRLNDYKNALACYERSIEIYPNGYAAHLDLAYLYSKLNRKEDQIKEYNIVKEIDPDNPESYYGLAILSVEEGNYQDAIQNAEEALKRYKKRGDSNCRDAEKLLSVIYTQKGDLEKARYWENAALTDKTGSN